MNQGTWSFSDLWKLPVPSFSGVKDWAQLYFFLNKAKINIKLIREGNHFLRPPHQPDSSPSSSSSLQRNRCAAHPLCYAASNTRTHTEVWSVGCIWEYALHSTSLTANLSRAHTIHLAHHTPHNEAPPRSCPGCPDEGFYTLEK